MESCRQSVCDQTLSQVKVYLAEGSYPLGATDDVRRIIRKRSKDFQVDGDTSTMYYKKVNGLSFSDRRHRQKKGFY